MNILKTCTICGESKPLDSFYKYQPMTSGYLNQCKRCMYVRNQLYRRNTYDPQKAREISIKRIKSGELAETARRMEAKYPEKGRARRALREAIKYGRVKKYPCSVCGSEKSEGHHDDYSKPFEVKWLCRKHHAFIHRKPLFIGDSWIKKERELIEKN